VQLQVGERPGRPWRPAALLGGAGGRSPETGAEAVGGEVENGEVLRRGWRRAGGTAVVRAAGRRGGEPTAGTGTEEELRHRRIEG
jgi:hypothetical protein